MQHMSPAPTPHTPQPQLQFPLSSGMPQTDEERIWDDCVGAPVALGLAVLQATGAVLLQVLGHDSCQVEMDKMR